MPITLPSYDSKPKFLLFDKDQLQSEILKGNRIALARGITLVESTNKEHQKLASELLIGIAPFTGDSYRIAITGSPGAGKSTFINSFGSFLCGMGKKVAVLSIDPSSEKSKGSILGDKTRMEELSKNSLAFIRPSPSGGELGGIARRTREAMLLCEAAGYEIILVETVGVGQNETAVHHLTDMFLLLLVTGSGDDLQGIKRGIMEIADLLIINKSDGENSKRAEQYRLEIAHAIHLFMANPNGWTAQTLACSSLENKGMESIWHQVETFFHQMKLSSFLENRRLEQNTFWLDKLLEEALNQAFLSSKTYQKFAENRPGFLSYFEAQQIVNEFINQSHLH